MEDGERPAPSGQSTGARGMVSIPFCILVFGILLIYKFGVRHGGVVTVIVIAICGILYITSSGLTSGMRGQRELSAFSPDEQAGRAALANGDLQTAFEIFSRWVTNSTSPTVEALSRLQLVWTLLHRGELQLAIRIANDNLNEHQDLLKLIGRAPAAMLQIAIAGALTGDRDLANRWMTNATEADEANEPNAVALYAFVRAILCCRAGDPNEAVRALDEHWTADEEQVAGSMVRPLRIVRAYALMTADLRNAGFAEAELAKLSPRFPAEYQLLGVAWPEMASFLVVHKLAPARTALEAAQA